jgi:hypothetical protein
MRPWMLAALSCTAVLASFAACGDDSGPSCKPDPAECDDSVTYESAVAPLANEYCVECHSTSLTTASERMNAPKDHNFDTEAGWLKDGAHALVAIKAGTMPKEGDPVPDEMVEKLEQWLTCNCVTEGDDHHAHDEEHAH